MHHLGSSRTSNQRDHALLTPDSFVRAPLPGMSGATAIVHAAPPLGAAFTQYTADFLAGGSLGPAPAQRFIYVLDGEIELKVSRKQHTLAQDDFAYIPAGLPHRVRSARVARAAIIEKPFHALKGSEQPQVVIGSERSLEAQPLLGDDALRVRTLLPSSPSYDFAVNTMTYEPGASLPLVESHVMEHGLLMLEGGGIYRLGDCWYPVKAGDFIWMAPYCPQWFGALGKTATRYLIYKDWNRHPQP